MRESKDREVRDLEERTLQAIDELQALDRKIQSLQKAEKIEPGDRSFKAHQGLLPDEKYETLRKEMEEAFLVKVKRVLSE